MIGLGMQREDKLLTQKKLDLAYRRFHFSFLTTLLVSAVLAVALWPAVAKGTLLGWLLVTWSVMAIRYFYSRRYLKLGHGVSVELGKWNAGFALGSAAAGLCWGITVFLFPATPHEQTAILLIFVIAGVAAFACVSMATVPFSVTVFLLAELLPVVIWLLTFDGREHFIMAGIALAHLGLMLLLSRQIYNIIRGSLTTTEQNKELTAAVGERDRRMQTFFSSAPGCYFTMQRNRDGVFSMPFASQGISDIFGLKPEEVADNLEPLLAIGHQDDIERMLRALNHAAQKMAPCKGEFRIAAQALGERWVAMQCMPQEVERGTMQWHGVMTDITERKKLEQSLQQREQEFRTLAENAPDPIYRYDRNCRRIYVNSAVERLTGKPVSELLGKSPVEFIPNPSVDALHAQRTIQQVLDTGEPGELEVQLVAANGREVVIHNLLVPEFDADGAVQSVLCLGRDVTARKRMEKEIAVREQEFRSLAENTPDAIIRYDRDGRIRYLNTVLQKILGLSDVAEVIGKRPCEAWPDGRFDEIAQTAARVVESGVATGMEISGPLESGERYFQHILVAPERDADGQIIGSIAFGRDITELKLAEEKRNELQRQLQMIADHLPGAMTHYRLCSDLSGQMLYASKGLQDLFGLAMQDLNGGLAPMIERIHPDDMPRAVAEQEHAARTLSTAISEFRVNHPEKGEVWVQQITTPVQESEASMLWYSLMFDITELKRIELKNTELQQRLSHMVANLPGFVYIFRRSPQGAYSFPYASEGLRELTGIAPEAVVDDMLPIFNLIHAEDQAHVLASIEASAANMSAYSSTFRVNTIHGELWIEATSKPQAQADGSILWHGVMLVVTERKRSEEQLELLTHALDQADPAFLIEDGRVVYANKSTCRVLGYSEEEMIGMEVKDIDPHVPPEQTAQIMQGLAERGSHMFESRHKTKNGDTFPVEVTVTLLNFGGKTRMLSLARDITQRKETEDALRDNEEFLRTVMDAIPLPVFYKDKEGRYLGFNKSFGEFTGATREQVIGKTISDFTPREVAEVYQAKDDELYAQGGVQEYEFKMRNAAGELRDAVFHKALFSDSRGTVRGMIGAAVDITERKRAERELQENFEQIAVLNQHLQENARTLEEQTVELEASQVQLKDALEFSEGVINAIPDLLFEVDRDGLYLNVWAQQPELLAAQKAALLGNTVSDVLSPEAAAICLDAVREADTLGLSLGKVISIDLPHGTSWFELSVSRMRGSVKGDTRFLVMSRDITERIRAEATLKKNFDKIEVLNQHLQENARNLEEQAVELEASKEQLQLTEAWYRGILHSAPDGMLVVDSRGVITLVNAQLGRMFGYAEGELIGQSIEVLVPISARGGHEAKRNGFIGADPHKGMGSTVSNLRGCRKDGSEFAVDISLSRLPDVAGGVGVICAAIRDVSERKRMEEKLAAREQEFRTLIENAPDVVVRYDLECRRTYVNPAWAQVNGLSAEEAVGKSPKELAGRIKPMTAEFEQMLREVMRTKCSSQIDLAWRNETGAPVCFLLSAIPEFDRSGEVVSVLTVARDISERKRMEEALAAREHESRTLVENTPDTIARYDRNCIRIFANPALADSVEGGMRALLGKKPSEVPGGPHSDAYEAKLREVLATGINAEFELTWPDKNGLDICSHIRLTAEFDAAGQVATVLAVGRDITELNIFRQKIHQMAFYDTLTSLPNRALFNDRLRQMLTDAEWHGQQAGVMLLDLDRFKAINDSLGHPAGDELLCEAAARLSHCVRSYDTVARMGGDEFAILLPEVRSGEDMGRVASKILEAFNEPFTLEGKEVFVSTSIGIAAYPDDSMDADDLIKQADSAMYFAKRSGRNNFRFYSKDLTASAGERLALESELRRAVERNELELFYQPKVRLQDNTLLGSEALLRWNNPQRGMVPPDQFISIAEDSGLIIEIGEWVLREACRTACDWNGVGMPLHKVAINLSARQFQSNDLVQTVSDILEETGCYPEWIELEITESLLLDEQGEVLEMLQAFRSLGISIAIDDFGTGYSALSYLARFPINTLKIDRSFIRTITTDHFRAELVKAILSIARCLGQEVVAEGVETLEQVAFLQAHGCQIGQGYLYSKPIPKAAFEEIQQAFAE